MNTSITGLQALLRRVGGLRGAVGHRRRAVSGFVRVDAARDSIPHGDEDAESHRGPCGEGFVHNKRQHVRHLLDVDRNHGHAADEIEPDLERR
jgi:hypothetical protein